MHQPGVKCVGGKEADPLLITWTGANVMFLLHFHDYVCIFLTWTAPLTSLNNKRGQDEMWHFESDAPRQLFWKLCSVSSSWLNENARLLQTQIRF